jgi:3-deoxy-D-manno-octulosonic-acid transferase
MCYAQSGFAMLDTANNPHTSAAYCNQILRADHQRISMINHYDIAYGLGVGVSAPYWLIRPSTRRKVLGAFKHRMGRVADARRDPARPAVMIHAVSLGEINATPALVRALHRVNPAPHVIVSTTTETGYERARQLYGSTANLTVIRYPLDFSKAVDRTLDVVRPDVVVLMELEVWPNFLRACVRRDIPVLLINGRLTPSSFRRYRMIKPVAAGMFRRLTGICVQDETYARRFVDLGANPGRVLITGTMKFDTAEVADRVAGDDELATAVGLFPGAEPIWVCGSTGPGEEAIVLRAYRQLLARHSRLRLVIVPRHSQRFDEVARLIEEAKFHCVRRSHTVGQTVTLVPTPGQAAIPPVVLGDTMGELRKFYSLADVVFVGRSLVDLGPRQHGSDMMEAAALAKPVITGPFTGNFAEVMNRFRAADAIMEVADEAALAQTVSVLLFSVEQAQAMARRAQAVVVKERGATSRNAEVVLGLLQNRTRR